MEDTSYKQGYQLFADKFNFEFNNHQKVEAAIKYEHAHDVKTTVYLLSKEDQVFLAYDMHSITPFMKDIYSGLYSTIEATEDFECKIAKKIPLLDFFTKPVTGQKFIDKNITVKTNDIRQTNALLDENIVKEYLELWNEDYPSTITIGKNILLNRNIDLFPDQYVVGVEFNCFLDPEILMKIYPRAYRLIQAIQQKAKR